MSKAGSRILQGAREALAYARGDANADDFRVHIPSDVDVKGIRSRLGLSQGEFAQRYGLTAARVRDWEQGRSKPDSAARAYLIVIEKDPAAVERALSPPTWRVGTLHHPRRVPNTATKSKSKRASSRA